MRVTHTTTGISTVARGRNFDDSLRLATRVVAVKVRAMSEVRGLGDLQTIVRRYSFRSTEKHVTDVRSRYATDAGRAVLDGDLDALLDASRRAALGL